MFWSFASLAVLFGFCGLCAAGLIYWSIRYWLSGDSRNLYRRINRKY